MRCWTVFVLVTAAAGLEWVNTGELAGARTVTALISGPNGNLYAAANIDTSSADSGWVFVSTDF
ncbi:MAG: hypothetical protein ABIK44_04795, partial [candidate division WOR-3 bacterium]